MKNYKILVLGQHTNNFGDDAAGIALMQRLVSMPNVEKVTVLYRFNGCNPIAFQHPQIVHDTKNFPVYKSRGRLRFLTDIANFILLGVLGNDYNVTFKKMIEEHDYIFLSPCGANIGSYVDRQLLFALLSSVRTHRKVITHLNSFDDSGDSRFNKIALYTLKKCYKVYTREKRSREYLFQQGISVLWGIDSAFMLQEEEMPSLNTEKNYIVLIVTRLHEWHKRYKGYNWTDEEYYNRIVSPVIKFATSMGRKALILPHTNSENEFLEKMKTFANTEVEDSCDICTHIESAFEYSRVIEAAYCVISCRYHGVVFAAKHCVPFIGISYDTKTTEVCEYTGCFNYHVEFVDLMEHRQELDDMLTNLSMNYSSTINVLNDFAKSEFFGSVYKPTEELLK